MASPKTKRKIARRRTVGNRGYYSTPQWRALALACKARDGERCTRCGMGRTKKRRLHAHHVQPRSQGGADHLDNLITLCNACHADEHPHMRRRKRTPKPKEPLSPSAADRSNSGETGEITDESSVS